MAEPRFAEDDDDLPRTLRRERDARERELREREMAPAEDGYGQAGPQAYGSPTYGYDYPPAGDGSVTVTRLKIPFLHLVAFFMKAVLAAIPALVLLTVLLWGLGQGLKAFFPALRHFEIIVKSAV
jgi:hypothetical protein